MMPGELVVRLRQRDQPSFEAVAEFFRARHAARGLRGERLHGRQRVLDAVIELVDQQPVALLGRLALGDVLHHAHQIEQIGLGVAHRRGTDRHPDHAAVLAHEALLDRIEFQLARQLLVERLVVGLGVVGMGGAEQMPGRQQFVAAEAGNVADRLVDAQEAAVGRQLGDADGGVLVGRGQALLLLERELARILQRGVDALALGDVDEAVDRADHRAAGVAQRIDIDGDDDAAAVLALDDALDVAHRLAAGEHLFHHRVRGRCAVEREIFPVFGKLNEGLLGLGSAAPNLRGAVIILQNGAASVADEGGDRQQLENAVGGPQ